MQPEITGYRIIRELGEGGMAVVYLAVQNLFERLVALKVMRLTSSANQDFAQRFVREARIIGALNHPNIVPVYEVGEHQGQFFFSMEFLPDGDLSTRIEKGINIEKVIFITSQLARALDYAHRHGVIHRDVKPDNILFRSSGEAVLTDFGIATDLNDNGNVTIVESVVGSPRYMSPEQTRAAALDSRSDVFSLGIVMYEMITGDYPFDGSNSTAIALQHMEKIPLTLPAKAKFLQPLLNKMIALEPTDRFPTALALADELDSIGAKAGFDPMRGFKAGAAVQSEERPTIVVDRKQARTLRREAVKMTPWWQKLLPHHWKAPAWIVAGIVFLALVAGVFQQYILQDRRTNSRESPAQIDPGAESARPGAGAAATSPDELQAKVSPGYYYFEPGAAAKTPFQQGAPQAILLPTPEEVYLYSDLASEATSITIDEYAARYPKSVFTEILLIKQGDDDLLTNVIFRADAGEEAALLILSELTDYGWSVAQDTQAALEFARGAARFDYPLGHYQAATILMQSDGRGEHQALLHLKKAVNGGLFLAMTTLADIYSNQGGIGSQERALQLYRKAADLGDREAMFKAGKIMLGGESATGTTFEALTYLNRAAAQGHVGADLLLEQHTAEQNDRSVQEK